MEVVMADHQYEPTTQELKRQWKRSGLWIRGHRFEEDIKLPYIAMSLRNAVIALHKAEKLPQQGSLQLEESCVISG
jgi:hypothetical protein